MQQSSPPQQAEIDCVAHVLLTNLPKTFGGGRQDNGRLCERFAGLEAGKEFRMGLNHSNLGRMNGSAPTLVEFCAAVPSHARHTVEALFFFNPDQTYFTREIRTTIEKSGIPHIVEREGRIWIGVPFVAMQCLFAIDARSDQKRPVGVVLYERVLPDILAVRHLAVDPDYKSGSGKLGQSLGTLLIEKVRDIGRRINGVRRVELPYRPGHFLPVHRHRASAVPVPITVPGCHSSPVRHPVS